MAKKLLTNNSGNMPVMDGLICWLDGRDGKNGDTVWKDRSGNGNDFILRNVTGNSFDGNSALFSVSTNIRSAKAKNRNSLSTYTFIINTFLNKSIRGAVFGGETYATTRIFNLGNGSIEYTNRDNKKTYLFDDKYNSLAISSNNNAINFYYNDTNIYTRNQPSNIEDFLFHINIVSNSAEVTSQKVASVLIYNRALTEAEIKHNYEYEKSIQRG